MEIMWYVEDGYCDTKSRPHKTYVDDDDLAACESEEERDKLIEDCVREDFEQEIGFYWE